MWQTSHGMIPAYIHTWECTKCGAKTHITTKSSATPPEPKLRQNCPGNKQNYGIHTLKHSVRKT